jgi:hypothetical protein
MAVELSGHYMYRQWSLYVSSVVTVCTTSGHHMYRQFNIQQYHVLPTQCIYVFCVYLRTNSDISLYSINRLHNACRRAFSLTYFFSLIQLVRLYAFDIIARIFFHNQHYTYVFVIQKQFSVRYRMDVLIVSNVSLGIFFGVPRERGRNVHRFSAQEAFAVVGCYTV